MVLYFVSTSPMDDLSDSIFRDTISNRKTFKMTKPTNSSQKKGEPVWSPNLEAAFFQGLMLYRPTSTKDSRTLQRFPRRNKNISEHILRTTGKVRTAKQVGSRLQQLRETCTVQWVLDLINNKDFSRCRIPSDLALANFPDILSSESSPESSSPSFPPSVVRSSSESSSPTLVSPSDAKSISLPSTPTPEFAQIAPTIQLPSFQLPTPAPQMPTVIPITLVIRESENFLNQSPTFTLDLDEAALHDSYPSNSPCSPSSYGHSTFTRRVDIRTSRPIIQSPPVVLFSSDSGRLPFTSLYRCITSVYMDKNPEVVYTDAEQPVFLKPFVPGGSSLTFWTTSLAPDYWGVMAYNPDEYHRYMIVQDIFASRLTPAGIYEDFKPALFRIEYNLECGSSFAQLQQNYIAQDVQYAFHQPWLFPNGQDEALLQADYTYPVVYDLSDPNTTPTPLPQPNAIYSPNILYPPTFDGPNDPSMRNDLDPFNPSSY